MEQTRNKETEIIEVPYVYTSGEYLYTCGELSKFFKEIVENKRLFGAKCPQCGKVWMPPRGYCPDCYAQIVWVPLNGKGTIISCAYCYILGGAGDLIKHLDVPFIQAIIQLDGTDTYLMHIIAVKEQHMGVVKEGMRVKAVFREYRKGTIADFYFVLEDDAS